MISTRNPPHRACRTAEHRAHHARRPVAVAEALEDRRLLAADFDVLVFSKTAVFRHSSISAGIAAIREMGSANNFSVTATEDAAAFNDANLAQFEAVVFLSTTGDVLDATQQSSFERYIGAGGGFVGVHAAADTEYGWAWYGGLVGAYFDSHPQIQQATIEVADQVHPATAGLPQRWTRTDEWYNYRTNPRGKVHVLATLDPNSYSGNTMGFDHPIAWCQDYQGGRSFYTGLGHTTGSYAEPLYRQHLLGGIRFAAGVTPTADAGATVTKNYRRTVLASDTPMPMQMDVARDGRVFWVERAGAMKMWNPSTSAVSTVGTVAVTTQFEDGLLGIALDPNFGAGNQWVYLFYSPPGVSENRVARFTLTGTTSAPQLDLSSERTLLRIATTRSDTFHSGGGLDFAADGTLYISVGDNTNPFHSSGYAPIDERSGRIGMDAQRTAANTNDLRGKILRIRPQSDGTYAIPAGNLFPADGSAGRPEIFVMGNRNPFRFTVDPETGWLYWGEVGPDARVDDVNRGPRGFDEFNQARSPGNYGWPYFIAENKAYHDYDFETGVSGPEFDPNNPVNESRHNTGARELPRARPSWISYPYATSTTYPELGTGGRAGMVGFVYHHDPAVAAASGRALPAYFDDTLFIYDYARHWIKEVKVDSAGNLLQINPFMPDTAFLGLLDLKLGPDGAIYVVEYRANRVSRLEYARPGTRPPIAVARADVDNGAVPLTVKFSSAGTDPGDRGPVTYAWDLNSNGTVDSTEASPTFTYGAAGNYTARLTVRDRAGLLSSASVELTVGNTRPTVTLTWPLDGSFFTWGGLVPYAASVTDPEDGSTASGTIAGSAVVVQPFTGHDEHAHPLAEFPGPAGTFTAPTGHGDGDDNIYLPVEARYTDRGGAGGARALPGQARVILQPRRKQAEHYTTSTAVQRAESGDSTGGGLAVGGLSNGGWIAFRPVNLQNINRLRYRLAAASSGVTVEARLDSPAGTLVSTLAVSPTGGAFASVNASSTNPGGTHTLYFVFRGTAAALAGFRLNWVEFERANNVAPSASSDSYSTAAGTRLDVPRASGLLANDSDANGDLIFAARSTGPANGTVVIHPDGSFTYTPAAGFVGTDSFSYRPADGALTGSSKTVTIQVGQSAGGSIAGTAFRDADVDGVRDTGEVGLSNWRIYLDADADGVFDSTERNTLTDGSGNYRFTGLAAGTHRVREVLPSGWRRTTPGSGVHTVTLTTGQSVTGRNFGNTTLVRISGVVYDDRNATGNRAADEPGLSGWRVFLDADNDGVYDSGERLVVTGTSGGFVFNVTAGTHRLRALPQAGWRLTQPTGGVPLYTLTLSGGQVAEGRNFGFTRTAVTAGAVFDGGPGVGANLSAWRAYIGADESDNEAGL